MISNGNRLDHQIISQIIEPVSRVLDLGCGKGELLYLLAKEKGAKVQGIEANDWAISECVKKGLSVYHGDLESGLTEYPDRAFDYVILNQSMQEVKKVDELIQEALRVGRRVIVGFPNFAYFMARLMLFFMGKSPITPSLPYRWFDTPNVRFLSISDFRAFCGERNLVIQEIHYLGEKMSIPMAPECTCPKRDLCFIKEIEISLGDEEQLDANTSRHCPSFRGVGQFSGRGRYSRFDPVGAEDGEGKARR